MRRHRTGLTKRERNLLDEMGVTQAVWDKINKCSNHTEGLAALVNAKVVCRDGYRVAAMKYHPDTNQHLSEEDLKKKEDHFKLLKAAFEYFTDEYRHQWPMSNTRRAATNFDPFGFQSVADANTEDILRNWGSSDDELMRNFRRMKRAQERQNQADLDHLESFRKREMWASMGLDYDEMMKREAAKPKEVVTVLANNKGVWYRDRSVWKKTTRPPKK